MKKQTPILFLCTLLAVCTVFFVGFFLTGPSGAAGNEIRASKPVFLKDGKLNTDYLGELSAYYADSFFARRELITAHNRLISALFGSSEEKSVILGKDGWLYYASTAEDYLLPERMTDAELSAAARNLLLMQENCERERTQFLFMIAPNKNSLYPQYMPYASKLTEHDAQRLQRRLAELGVNYLDLFTLLGDAEETLYYAHDSHWNDKGAAMAADAVNAAFGKETQYAEGEFTLRQHDGDLFAMIYPAAADSEKGLAFAGNLDYTYTSKTTAPDSIRLTTEAPGEGSLLCCRDSFGNDLHPFLAASYASAQFSRSARYDLTQSADAVLIELVERNLSWLLSNVPEMAAPMRVLELPECIGSIACTQETSRAEGCVLLRGSLTETAERVYVQTSEGVYEAFLLKDGFAAHVPGEVLAIYVLQDGQLCGYQAD